MLQSIHDQIIKTPSFNKLESVQFVFNPALQGGAVSLYEPANNFLTEGAKHWIQNDVPPGQISWIDELFPGWEINRVEKRVTPAGYFENGQILVELHPTDAIRDGLVTQDLRSKMAKVVPKKLDLLDADGIKYKFVDGGKFVEYSKVIDGKEIRMISRRWANAGYSLSDSPVGKRTIARMANDTRSDVRFSKLIDPNNLDQIIPTLKLFDSVFESQPGIVKVDVKIPLDKLPDNLVILLDKAKSNVELFDNRTWKANVTKAFKQTVLGSLMKDMEFNRGLMRRDLEAPGVVTFHLLMNARADRVSQIREALQPGRSESSVTGFGVPKLSPPLEHPNYNPLTGLPGAGRESSGTAEFSGSAASTSPVAEVQSVTPSDDPARGTERFARGEPDRSPSVPPIAGPRRRRS